MYSNLAKPTLYAFVFTALVYLISVSFIQYPLTTLLKPIPILCLIIGVWQQDLLPGTKYLLLIALSLSMAGDIGLTLPLSSSLELGLGCFLLAHCFYISLFLKSFKFRLSHLFYYLLFLAVMLFCSTFIIFSLGSLLVPTVIYACVLMLMVFSAFQVSHQGLIIGAGALIFALSDLILAFNLFVYPKIDGSILVMFTYYLAQLLITLGAIALYRKTDNYSGRR